jgi:hypothetical protein
MTMQINDIFIKNSSWTWNKLREARKLGNQLREESITDFLILNIKNQVALSCSSRVLLDIKKRLMELIGNDGLQDLAESVLECVFKQKCLNWILKNTNICITKKNRQQVDLLVQDAVKGNMIPAYCMYTNWDPKKYNTHWKCRIHKTSVRHYGTALLSARKVKAYQASNETRLSQIINDLKPMHCIFFCLGHGGSDLPLRALNYALWSGLLQVNADGDLGE